MGWQRVGLGIVAAVALAGGADTACRACESGLCIDPSLYSTAEGQAGHSAAYAVRPLSIVCRKAASSRPRPPKPAPLQFPLHFGLAAELADQ